MLKPETRIIDASPQLNRDVQGINSDIPFGQAQFATPSPYFAEQPLVKLKHKGITQNVGPSQAFKPAETCNDVCLFKLVEFALRAPE
jgi:hypothetical protein